MEGIEIEGKTINEAIENACEEFNVPREKLNIEIVAEGNSGFLGMGAKKALIRARLLSFDMALDEVFPQKEKETPAPERKKKHVVPAPERAGAGSDAGGNKAVRDAATPKAQTSVSPVATRPTAKPKAPEPVVKKADEKPHPVLSAVDGGETAADRAKRILEGILTRMQIVSSVTVEEKEEAIILNIQGDGSGLLIGKRGQNLDAIQYIVNKAVHDSTNGNKMIVIDTEEYRKRREESLLALAARIGEKVRKTRKPVTVGHMNAHDRRVIHMAMQNDETLTTKSRGDGEYRKIVILPARSFQNGSDA
jgi:spoIIIJ-associated protein